MMRMRMLLLSFAVFLSVFWPIELRTPTALLSSQAPAADAAAHDWIMYLGDVGRSNYNRSETAISPSTASMLHPLWTVNAQGVISAQPIIANNLVYWSAWDCYFRATNLSGALVWQDYLGSSPCSSKEKLASSPAIGTLTINGTPTSVLFEPAGPDFFALNALTGAVIWKIVQQPMPGTNWSSPVLYNGALYTTRSGVIELDPLTGSELHVFHAFPAGCPSSIWDSPTIDTATNILYFASGDGSACTSPAPYAQSIVALTTANLSLVGSWKIPDWQAKFDGDYDIGSTPVLFSASMNGSNRQMVGITSKNGIFYAFDRSNLSNGPMWETTISMAGQFPEHGMGSVATSAFDGSYLYVAGGATVLNGIDCPGSLRKIDPATGSTVWADCFSDGWSLPAVGLVPGLVLTAEGNEMKVVDTARGDALFTYANATGLPFYGPATVSNGILYEGDSGGILYAFVAAGPSTTVAASPSHAAYPAVVTVDGHGFTSGETVSLYWDNVESTPISQAVATSGDAFNAVFKVPHVPYGMHTLIAAGGTSHSSASTPFAVTPQMVLKHPSGPPTGSNVLTGHGFGSNETVDVSWATSAGSPVGTLYSTTTNTTGDFSGLTVALPKTQYFLYVVSGTGRSSAATARAYFTIRPTITGPTTVFTGSTAKIRGVGFWAGELATLYWGCVALPCTSSPVTSALADSTGSFTGSLPIPALGSLGPPNPDGTYTVLAQGGITGLAATLALRVEPPADHFSVSVPAATTAGSSFPATVTAEDVNGNVVTGYRGTVELSSSDPNAILPAAHTFDASDAGTYTFSMTLQTLGAQTVRAIDAANSSLTGSATTTVGS